MPKIVQNEYTKAYNKEHYKNVSIKVSPEEAAEIDEIARQTGQSKARLIVNAVRFYAQSLTAASPAPEEISPQSNTGAKETHTKTETETPEEDQPQQDGRTAGTETPTASTVTPAPQEITPTTPTTPTAGAIETHPDERQDSQPDYISKAGEDAQRAAERENTHTAARTYTREELEEIAGRIAERAARKAYQRAVQEERVRATARRVRATARRVKAAGKIPAKIGKG